VVHVGDVWLVRLWAARGTADFGMGGRAPCYCHPQPYRAACRLTSAPLLHVAVPGRGRRSGKPVLSEAARCLPSFDLGAAALVNCRLRPRRRHHAPRRWFERHLSVNVRAPFGCMKGLLRCMGVRG
jgi:hypothetical protein